jgi:heme-degrading monooxygenase HmoA
MTRVDTGDLPREVSTIVAEEIERWLAGIEGFLGFVMLAREGSSVALSFWESREAAERHSTSRAQVRERATALAGANVEEVVEYEVAFAHLGPLKLIPPT